MANKLKFLIFVFIFTVVCISILSFFSPNAAFAADIDWADLVNVSIADPTKVSYTGPSDVNDGDKYTYYMGFCDCAIDTTFTSSFSPPVNLNKFEVLLSPSAFLNMEIKIGGVWGIVWPTSSIFDNEVGMNWKIAEGSWQNVEAVKIRAMIPYSGLPSQFNLNEINLFGPPLPPPHPTITSVTPFCVAPNTPGITLNWNDVLGEDWYSIYRLDPGAPAYILIASPPANFTSYTDTDVGRKMNYSYFMRAESAAGGPSPNSNIVNVSSLSCNSPPVAEASIVVGGVRYSFENPLVVNKGVPITITSFDADINVNAEPLASYDPDGWTDPVNGVSSGNGKCEWNYDFSGTYDNPSIINPASPSDCNIGPKFVTFNAAGANQEFAILKITDRENAVSIESRIKVTVNELCSDECSNIGDTLCVSPGNPNNNNYKDCGHYDDFLPGGDVCLELNPTPTPCGANETCVQKDANTHECKALPIIDFSAAPPEIVAGNFTTLSWDVQNMTPSDNCIGSSIPAYPNWDGNPINSTKSASGNELGISPPNTTAFTLTCANTEGNAAKTINVRVIKAPVQIETLRMLKNLLAGVSFIFKK